MRFPRSVEAARRIGMEKMELAEALYEEIPPRGKGRRPAGETTSNEMFEQVAQEIFDETGEHYTPVTLKRYRNVAAWVVAGKGPGPDLFQWADASWTAHREAFENGLTWEEFTQGKRTKRAVRQQAGISTGDVPAAARAVNENPTEAYKLVEGLSKEARDAVVEAAMVKEVGEITGLKTHAPQSVPDPRPKPLKYVDMMRTAYTGYRATIPDLRAQDPEAADECDKALLELIINIQVWLDPVPDSPEGVER